MAQHYSDPSRESDDHSLPDVETFQANYRYCPECESLIFNDAFTGEDGALRANCGNCGYLGAELTARGWFYWFCSPGCLPDSEPFGPFESQQAAIDDARETWE